MNEELLVAAANNLAKKLWGTEVLVIKDACCDKPGHPCNCGYSIRPTHVFDEYCSGFGTTYEEALVSLIYKLGCVAQLDTYEPTSRNY